MKKTKPTDPVTLNVTHADLHYLLTVLQIDFRARRGETPTPKESHQISRALEHMGGDEGADALLVKLHDQHHAICT